MIKIAHFGDCHIHNLQRHEEYREVFQKIYIKLEEQQPDKIVIAGDLFEKFVQITNEAKTLASEFLHTLADIAKVIIVPGNHDFMKKNKKRLNSVFTLVHIMKNPNITYFGHSDFYEDDDLPIVWVNYSHLEKDILPWRDIPHKENKKKIYIGIHHDPVNSATNDLGLTFKSSSYLSPEDFEKNAYTLLADIHKRQYFRDGRIAYCGSTIQQNFGEHPADSHHGYLLWEIDDKESFKTTEVWVENPYRYITLVVNKDYNYDNIELENDYITPQSEVRVKWHEYSAYINFENEIKIRTYIKEKWGIDKVKFERENIFTDVSDVEMVSESINVLDAQEQRKIFLEFLKENKHKEDYIEAVMNIDEIVNGRLDVNDNLGLNWSIDNFWFNNFRSYGDGNYINWEKTNGIYQLSGLNQQGKTTVLDAISYILYGKTSSTLKRERHGDARFLNNKRDKDTVDCGAVITINGVKYTIIRETVRKWNKTKSGTASVLTNVEYYLGDDPSAETKLNDEQKRDTQRLLETAIGDFEDFLRLVLTTADNLNDLLSMDRSVFIDALIRDAGFDIFDKKLNEFKEYRKEITEKRKNINIEVVETETERIIEEKISVDESLEHIISVIDELNETKKLQNTIREEKIKQLDKIDETLKDLDEEEINLQINIEKQNIDMGDLQLEKIEELKKKIAKYDPDILEEKEEKYDELTETINNAKLGQSEYENKISENNNEIKFIGIDIENIITNYTNDLESKNKDLNLEMVNIKNEFVDGINVYLSEANQKVSKIAEEQSKIHNEIDTLMNDGKHLKNENHELENSSVCITCERPLEDVDRNVIHEKILDNKNRMTELMIKVNELKPHNDDLIVKLTELKEKIAKIRDKDYSFDTELLNTYNKSKEKIKTIKENIERNNTTIDLIKNNNIPGELSDLIAPSYKRKSELSLYIDDLQKEMDNITKDLSKKKEEYDSLKLQIADLKEDKTEIDTMKVEVSTETTIYMNIEKSKTKIRDYEKQLEDYKSTLDKIKKNEVIEKEITSVEEILAELEKEISNKVDERMNYQSTLKLFDSQLDQYKEDIKVYNKYKKQDEIMNTYMKCVHRDGLPTFLLKKSIHIINQELSKVLTDVDFTVYFDSELNLKLSADNRLDIMQNAIESSGMEKTFTAVALKMALRKVNNKSKPNFILLDEIMGKLVEGSVEMFITMLDNIKEDVDKLVIIEHIHPINYDVLIQVEKDIEGVSTLVME